MMLVRLHHDQVNGDGRDEMHRVKEAFHPTNIAHHAPPFQAPAIPCNLEAPTVPPHPSAPVGHTDLWSAMASPSLMAPEISPHVEAPAVSHRMETSVVPPSLSAPVARPHSWSAFDPLYSKASEGPSHLDAPVASCCLETPMVPTRLNTPVAPHHLQVAVSSPCFGTPVAPLPPPWCTPRMSPPHFNAPVAPHHLQGAVSPSWCVTPVAPPRLEAPVAPSHLNVPVAPHNLQTALSPPCFRAPLAPPHSEALVASHHLEAPEASRCLEAPTALPLLEVPVVPPRSKSSMTPSHLKESVVPPHSEVSVAPPHSEAPAVPPRLLKPVVLPRLETPVALPRSNAPVTSHSLEAQVSRPAIPVKRKAFNESNNAFITKPFSDISQKDVEAFLYQAINSNKALEFFMLIPQTSDSSMEYGAQLQNKKKNRFRNNLPYDKTRVRLSTINNNPYSDYINASHVYGYGGSLKYIASQGPKDSDVNTNGDFWRMIIEKNVTAVIMLANFIEGGRNKVGKYFQHGMGLHVGDYMVRVLKTGEYPKYRISTIQVRNRTIDHKITHYHYTKWPDHHEPTEPQTLASMLRTVITNHQEGCILVHCSAGIGRTGTVLMVLLLHEMLSKRNVIQPLKVVQRLRECRGRLVENPVQYNLGLKIFEELEFGILHTVLSKDLGKNLLRLLQQAPSLHAKAKSLPNNLTFSCASDNACINMTRSKVIFPSDSSRVFLQMKNGESSSQYINAVMIEGIEESSSAIATEHPLPPMVRRFWRLVMEKRCHSIVIINTFNGLEKEFQAVLPKENTSTDIGRYSLLMTNVIYYDGGVKSNVKILSRQLKTEHNVTVYQVNSWQYGKNLPSSPYSLLRVCDLIVNTRRTEGLGPTLLTCGDGVTGCGVMAALMSVVDQLWRYQKINIYRTLVRLQRVRPEFLVTSAQFEFLYTAANCYIEMYSS